MALFQKAPRTREELERSQPLPIPPDQVLEMNEEEWYAKIYRGDGVPQLTVRAVIMGLLLGFVLAFTNVYVGLKTGWGLGVVITAAILSYSLWSLLLRVGVARSQMTILETNCMQSTASSAGYATGTIMVSAVSALLMLSATPENAAGKHLPLHVLLLWTFFLGVLGTMMAIPMKRRMINGERLKFPTGTAAAVTLQSLYSAGAEAAQKGKALLLSALGGAVFPLLIDLELLIERGKDGIAAARHALLPASSAIFDFLPARGTHFDPETGREAANKPSDWTLVLDHNPVMIGAGALVGLRVTVYMTLSSLFLAYFLGPAGYDNVWQSKATGEMMRAASEPWKAWKEIGVWLGVPIMVASGLLSFVLQWRTIARAFSGLLGRGGASGAAGGSAYEQLVARTEVPASWFLAGTLLSGAGVVWLAHSAFGIPAHWGALAVLMTFVLSLVACRATGESDITPTGAMGKIMQLVYGVAIPQNATANLMTASITSNASVSAADLLSDLKSGYLLGANPRRQFFAQLFGVLSGTLATTLCFRLLVRDATTLTGAGDQAPAFPAPAAQTWKAVADVFVKGIDNMHPMFQSAIGYGLGLGVVMVMLEQLLPKSRKWLPSATGIGLGLILPFQYPFSMLLGAAGAALWTRASRKSGELYVVPVASGLIAGVSIMGVVAAVLNNFLLHP